MVSATEASLEDSIIIPLAGLVEVEIGCGEGLADDSILTFFHLSSHYFSNHSHFYMVFSVLIINNLFSCLPDLPT